MNMYIYTYKCMRKSIFTYIHAYVCACVLRALQCVAVCCSVLQYVIVCCIVMYGGLGYVYQSVVCCSVLQ